jgi:hypothetical protein
MNFQNLINKIGELDKPITQLKEQAEFKFSSDMDLNAVKKLSGLNESEVAECGMSPMGGLMGGASTPPVTMNVSMNASGTESIRDLMDLLKGADGAGDAVSGPVGVVSVSGDDHDTDDFDRSNDDDADDLDREIDEIEVAEISDPANAPDERYGKMADAAPNGNDLNSHGGNEAEKVNGGGNPYAQVSEGLMAQLQNLYTEIKNR